jgi:hypothetical protein
LQGEKRIAVFILVAASTVTAAVTTHHSAAQNEQALQIMGI